MVLVRINVKCCGTGVGTGNSTYPLSSERTCHDNDFVVSGFVECVLFLALTQHLRPGKPACCDFVSLCFMWSG